MGAAATPVRRERGWGPVVAALVACLAVGAVPLWPPAAGLAAALVRLAVPVEQTMLLVIPALAACATVGWWAGGRLGLAVVWLVLAGWVLVQPLPQAGGYGALARGWALLLAGAFGVACVVGGREAARVPAAEDAVAVRRNHVIEEVAYDRGHQDEPPQEGPGHRQES